MGRSLHGASHSAGKPLLLLGLSCDCPGLPIGSGVVEAACKTLATQRLKRSGMSWSDGKQPILTIRSLQQSNRWDRGWALVAAEFQKTPLVVEARGELTILTQPGYVAAA